MFLMTKMTGILFNFNYKNYHKFQGAGFQTKYKGNINLKDNSVTEEGESKDTVKKALNFFLSQALNFHK